MILHSFLHFSAPIELGKTLKARVGSPHGNIGHVYRMLCVGVMNPSNSFAQAALRAFDNWTRELQRSAEDDNLTEELEEFLKIMDNNDVDEEDFYKYLELEHEDEDCAISSSARNYPTHATRVTFDDDDDIIELANYLTGVEFSDCLRHTGNPSTVFPYDRRQLTTPRDYKEILLERVMRSFLPVCVKWKRPFYQVISSC